MSVVHVFSKSLAVSQAQADFPFWFDVYRRAFPDLEAAVRIRGDGWGQRGGIDRVLVLASGKTLTVDEKIRSQDWDDILLEYYSDHERRTPGWIAKDLACDLIAYAFEPSRRCYLFPFQTLRAAWRANALDWTRLYPRVEAVNSGYISVSVAVPIRVLMESLSGAMRIVTGANEDSDE
jgi:hypothetical protein